MDVTGEQVLDAKGYKYRAKAKHKYITTEQVSYIEVFN